jgi:lysophospholipase L1-like esterase
MSEIRVLTSTALAFAVAAAAAGAADSARAADAGLRAELERVAQRRIFFGHQSVGVNLLDGVAQLAAAEGVPLRVAEAASASRVAAATLGHAFVAENGNPLRKLQSFELAMGQQPTPVEVALVKLCYVDFTAETDVKTLFARYRDTIDRLRSRHPGTTFVHVTAPLTDVQQGAKALLKRLLGHAPYGTIENVRRAQYNNLLREAYRGREPIFDLARVESTAPDGTTVTTEWKDSVVPAMAPAFTDDGGHLNAAGKLRAARELVSVLAALPREPVR